METWGDVSPHFTRHLPTNVSLDDALLLKLLEIIGSLLLVQLSLPEIGVC